MVNFGTSRFNSVVLEHYSIASTTLNFKTITLEEVISKVSFPNSTACESVGTGTVDFSINDGTLKNSAIGVLSLVRTSDLVILILSPMLTTIFKLNVAINFLVSVPVTSVNITVAVVENTMTGKSVTFPRTNISVTILVVALTLSIRLSFDEVTFVGIARLEQLGTSSGSETISPVTVIVSTSAVSKLTSAVVEVVEETTIIDVSVVLEALALAIAFTILELSFGDITVVVSHLTPTGHLTLREVTFVRNLIFTGLKGVLSFTVESIVHKCTGVGVTFTVASVIGHRTLAFGNTVLDITIIGGTVGLKGTSGCGVSDLSGEGRCKSFRHIRRLLFIVCGGSGFLREIQNVSSISDDLRLSIFGFKEDEVNGERNRAIIFLLCLFALCNKCFSKRRFLVDNRSWGTSEDEHKVSGWFLFSFFVSVEHVTELLGHTSTAAIEKCYHVIVRILRKSSDVSFEREHKCVLGSSGIVVDDNKGTLIHETVTSVVNEHKSLFVIFSSLKKSRVKLGEV